MQHHRSSSVSSICFLFAALPCLVACGAEGVETEDLDAQEYSAVIVGGLWADDIGLELNGDTLTNGAPQDRSTLVVTKRTAE